MSVIEETTIYTADAGLLVFTCPSATVGPVTVQFGRAGPRLPICAGGGFSGELLVSYWQTLRPIATQWNRQRRARARAIEQGESNE